MKLELNLQKHVKATGRNSKPLDRSFDPSHFDEVIGHGDVVHGLQRLICRGGIDMPVLLVGPPGSARTALGRVLARAVNCAETTAQKFGGRADCTCDACKATANFGGFSYAQIDLADVNSALKKYSQGPSMPPLDGGRRCFVLLRNVDKSLRGTDHLLKWLERRTSNVPILAAEDTRSLPETIVSRCAVFRLHPLRQVEMEALCRRMLRIACVSVDEADVPWIASLCDGQAGQLETLVRYISELSELQRTDLRSNFGPANWVLNFADYLEQRLCGDEPVVDGLSGFHTLNHARRFVVAMFGDPARTLATSVVGAGGHTASRRLETLRNEFRTLTVECDWVEVCGRIRAIASNDYASDAWCLLDEIADDVRAMSGTTNGPR